MKGKTWRRREKIWTVDCTVGNRQGQLVWYLGDNEEKGFECHWKCQGKMSEMGQFILRVALVSGGHRENRTVRRVRLLHKTCSRCQAISKGWANKMIDEVILNTSFLGPEG